MQFQKGNKAGTGGKRSGAGRKPKASTLLQEKFLKQQHKEAQYAFNLVAKTMRDPKAETELRVECAGLVMDRVYGKPKQALALGLEAQDHGPSVWGVMFYNPDAAAERA